MISRNSSKRSTGIPPDYDFRLAPSIRKVKPPSSPSIISRLIQACKRPVYDFTQDYYYCLPDGTIGLIPAGFRTDFASIPRIFFFLPGMTPTGVLMAGSIPHDFGYRHNKLLDQYGEWKFVAVGRVVFDNIMRDINLRDEKVVSATWIAYSLLRAFGWIAWKNNRKRETGELNLLGEYKW